MHWETCSIECEWPPLPQRCRKKNQRKKSETDGNCCQFCFRGEGFRRGADSCDRAVTQRGYCTQSVWITPAFNTLTPTRASGMSVLCLKGRRQIYCSFIYFVLKDRYKKKKWWKNERKKLITHSLHGGHPLSILYWFLFSFLNVISTFHLFYFTVGKPSFHGPYPGFSLSLFTQFGHFHYFFFFSSFKFQVFNNKLYINDSLKVKTLIKMNILTRIFMSTLCSDDKNMIVY